MIFGSHVCFKPSPQLFLVFLEMIMVVCTWSLLLILQRSYKPPMFVAVMLKFTMPRMSCNKLLNSFVSFWGVRVGTRSLPTFLQFATCVPILLAIQVHRSHLTPLTNSTISPFAINNSLLPLSPQSRPLTGARGRLPETGWQWRGYMSWYEVDLHVLQKDAAQECWDNGSAFAW